MKHEEVVRKLCVLLAEQLQQNPADFGAQTSLEDDVVLDSLAQMAFVVAIENFFEVCLSVDEGEAMPKTIGALAQLVLSARSGPTAS